MDVPVNFKFDVRIRARMLAKGMISDADVTKHVDGLPDREAETTAIDLAQPALTPPGERPPVNVRPAPRPAPVAVAAVAAVAERSAPMSVAPPPLPVDEGWGDEADDDEDDDEDDEDGDEAEELIQATPVVADEAPVVVDEAPVVPGETIEDEEGE
jgi:hypothetical protein